MTQMLASATVVDARGSRDCAVPLGTTVAGLMALLEVDGADRALKVTTADGRPVDPAAVIGADLPSGSVIAVSDRRESRRAVHEAADHAEAAWFRPVFAGLLLILSVVIVEGAVLVAPFFCQWRPEPAIRWAAAAVCALICAAPLRFRRVREMPWLVLAISALWGVTSVAAVPAGHPFAGDIAPVVTIWWSFIGSLAVWALFESALSTAVAGIWGVFAVLASLRGLSLVGLSDVAGPLVAVAVMCVALTPRMSVRIPESQLLDLPLVSTGAASLRGPEPRPPSRITMARVRRTLEDARMRTRVLLVVCTAVLLVCAPSVAADMTHETWRGRAAIVLIASSFLALASLGRGRRLRGSRVLPRAGAAIIAVAALTSRPALDVLGTTGCAVVRLLIGLVQVAGSVVLSSREPSALAGRVVDVVESASLMLILPAAVVASGFFDIIRQVAS